MKSTDAAALLQAWEATQGEHLIRRGLALLAVAWPEVGSEGWSRVPIGVRDASLLRLRDALFGAELETVAGCPECGERVESSFTTRDIQVEPPEPPSGDASFQLCEQGCVVDYRLPTSEDVLGAVQCTSDLSAATQALLRRCVVAARRDGSALDPAELPATVVTVLGAAMQQRDPGAELRIALTCPACQHFWSLTFDIVAYLWSEIDDWAQRLLADVFVLARACGWSERDILALSPTRRQTYLDMVLA